MRCGNLILTHHDKSILLTGKELSDKHIDFAQLTAAITIPGAEWLKVNLVPVSLSRTKTNVHALQIVHSRGNHWIVATTLLCIPGEVKIYDSIYNSLFKGHSKL